MNNINFNLNPGGIIGALAFAGVAVFIILTTFDIEIDNFPGRLVIMSLVVGAIVGNFMWSLVFKKRPDVESVDPSDEELS